MVAKIYNSPLVRIQQGQQAGIEPQQQSQAQIASTPNISFQRILADRTAAFDGISFSAHAQKRLEQRAISFTPKDIARLSDAVSKAATKGARESLVLLNDLALVVSISNRKVITAMDTDSMKENVITNIDSAVIA